MLQIKFAFFEIIGHANAPYLNLLSRKILLNFSKTFFQIKSLIRADDRHEVGINLLRKSANLSALRPRSFL